MELMDMDNIKISCPTSSGVKDVGESEAIAIIGISCRFPKAENAEEFWELISSMEEAVMPVPKSRMEIIHGWNSSVVGGFLQSNVTELDGRFFEMSRPELNYTDPQQRMALEISWEALEDARMDPLSLKGTKLGVFSGCWRTDYQDLMTAKSSGSKEGKVLRQYVGNGHGAIPGRLSYFYGGQGPSIATDSACSSSMGALSMAISSLRNGTSDVALVVGANLILFPYDTMNEAIFSPDGRCKTFEESANGYGRAEGVAVLVLKRLNDALKNGDRIHSVILGVGSCTKSREGSLVTPDIEGEALCMKRALEDAGVKPGEVGYVELHGTGTSAGDLTECQAVRAVYDKKETFENENTLYIGSVKANIGHPEACSGLAGVIKTTWALKNKVIPPHRKIHKMNKKLKIDETNRIEIPHEIISWETPSFKRRLAGVSSFGLLGSYYHVIMEEFTEEHPTSNSVDKKEEMLPWSIFTFSAKSQISLVEIIKQYLTFWESDQRPRVCDAAFSSCTTRAHLNPFRASIVKNNNWKDLQTRLSKAESLVKLSSSSKPKICFLLTGQGSQYHGMGKELYTSYPAFKFAFDQCFDILKWQHNIDLSSYLWANSNGYSDFNLLYNQAGIFVMEYCMAELLRSLGIVPTTVVGHSLGEYTAACISGIVSLNDAIRMIVMRAQLLLKLSLSGQSAMLAIRATLNEVSSVLSEYTQIYSGNAPEICAINSIEQVVLGGSEEVIKRTKGIAESRGMTSVLLLTSHAFHSSLMDPILPEYSKFISTVSHTRAHCQFISSVSGMAGNTQDSVKDWVEYWRDVTRKPVDFVGACSSTALKNIDIFVELGPHPVLSGLIASNIPNAKTVITMKRGADQIKCFSEALSSLYTMGHDIDWQAYYSPYPVTTVDLPFYQFNKQVYWFPEDEDKSLSDNNVAALGNEFHPLLGNHTRTAQNTHIFDAQIDLKKQFHFYLKDHKLGNTFVFPGAGYAEIALAITHFLRHKLSPPDGNYLFENLNISKPLGKSITDSLCIQTHATPKDDGSYFLEMFGSGDSLIWHSYASCSLHSQSRLEEGEKQKIIPIPDWTAGISTVDLYQEYYSLGYTFGSDFQRLRKYWQVSENTTIFHMDLRGMEKNYILHPIIIDAMIVAATFVENTKRVFVVPVAIQRLTAYLNNIMDKEVFIHVRSERDKSRTQIVLVNENQDKIIARMEGLVTVETSVTKIKQSLTETPKMQNNNLRILKEIWKKEPIVQPGFTESSQIILEQFSTWLFYVPDSERVMFRELCESMKKTGRKVVLVGNIETAENAIATSSNLEGFFYAAGLDSNSDNPEMILKSFVLLMQKIITKYSSSVLPRVVVPVRGVWYSQQTDAPLRNPPFGSSLWGFCKTLRSEYPDMTVKSIDINEGEIIAVGLWMKEILSNDREQQIALRRGERFVLRLTDGTKLVETNSKLIKYPQAGHFKLSLPSSNQINDLSFIPSETSSLGKFQVSIDVRAVGLNFKDVLCVIKPSEFFLTQNTFAMDIAGIVSQVGTDAFRKDIKVGDKIAIINRYEPFSSSMNLKSDGIIKLPDTWSFEEGATVAVPFITAYYCLMTLAKMTAQDTVLIHTGSGGVGIAAIQLAKHIGAKIISTAGNKRKQAYLKSIGVDVVLDSRSLEFGDKILEATNGNGVDIVLNSLTGKGYVETSLKSIRRNCNGRFIEMSKLNIWTEDEVAAYRPDVKYWAVYVADLDETTMVQICKSLEELIWRGKISPIPKTTFVSSGVIPAVKYLQEGKHIGKVVLKLPEPHLIGKFTDAFFCDSGLYMITGGFGGIGIEIASWMVSRGARHLVLCSRRPNSETVQRTIDILLEKGAVTIETLYFDIANAHECRSNILTLKESHPNLPFKGIFHCAGVLSDGIIANQTGEKIQEVLNPKWNGTWNLHRLSLELNLPLDYFVMFSSITALVGPIGQGNYTAANAAMDAITWHRYSLGLPATTINWGQWAEVGLAANRKIPGFEAFSTESAIANLEKVLLLKETQVAITSDVRQIPDTFLWAKDTYFEDESGNKQAMKQTKENFEPAKDSLSVEALKNTKLSRDDKFNLLQHHVSSTVRNLLEFDSDEFLDLNISVHQLGLDSLMMIQLKNKMIKDLEPLGLQSNNVTIANTDTITLISQKLSESLDKSNRNVLSENKLGMLEDSELIHDDCKLPENFPTTVDTFPAGKTPSTILLTGATGNLGIYVLQMLTRKRSTSKVYCLVRKNTGRISSISRLQSMYEKNHLFEPDWTKVIFVEGSVNQEKLGMKPEVYEELKSVVDGVIHLAAKVNHAVHYSRKTPIDPEDDVRTVNALGMKHILKFSCSGRAKKFCYGGTFMAVRHPDPATNKMNENWCRNDEFDGCLNLGYCASKFIGEMLVKAAVERGLAGYVLRLPFIGGDSKQGMTKETAEKNHLMLRFISYLQTGVIPNILVPINCIPVDTCAKLFLDVFLSASQAAIPGVYNISNPHSSRESDFLIYAKQHFGVTVKLVEFDEYLEELKVLGFKSALLPLMEVYETKEILKYFTGSPTHAAWMESEVDFYKSQKLNELFGNEYMDMENPMTTVVRDLLAAKRNKLCEKFGIVPK